MKQVKAWLHSDVAELITSAFAPDATQKHRKLARSILTRTEKKHGAGHWTNLESKDDKTLVEFIPRSEVFGTSTADVTLWDRQRNNR